MCSVQPSYRKKLAKNKNGFKIYTRTSSILGSPNKKSVIFCGTLRKKNNKSRSSSSSSSNTMHMSLCLVKNGNSSLGKSTVSNNPPHLTNYEVSGSESAPASVSSPSSATLSSQEDGSRMQGQPVGSAAASTEEQRKMMSKPTNTTLSHGVISVVGRRRSMEDAVTIAPGLFHVTVPADGPTSGHHKEVLMRGYDFFAVYNGRGSHAVAQKCKERLHHVVAEQYHVVGVDGSSNWERVLVTSFAMMEDEFGPYTQELDGLNLIDPEMAIVQSMALVVLVGKEDIVVANCGHSRAIVCRDGAPVPLCSHNQPERPEPEQDVTCSLKQQMMMSAPEVKVHKRTSSDEFLIIATDGLWNVVSNEMACDIVKKRCTGEAPSKKMIDGVIGNGADACAAMLVELALARRSKDNISVIVVELQHFRADGSTSSSECNESKPY